MALIRKVFFELLFEQASSLYEIIYYFKNEKNAFAKHLSQESNHLIKNILKKDKDDSDKSIVILKTIRHQHSFHIGREHGYVRSNIDDLLQNNELTWGAGSSTKEKDYLYTIDVLLLFEYLAQKINLKTEEKHLIHDMILDSVAEYTRIFMDISNEIIGKIIDINTFGKRKTPNNWFKRIKLRFTA